MKDDPAPGTTEILAKLLLQGCASTAELSLCDPEDLLLTARWHHVLLSTYTRLRRLPGLPEGFLHIPWLRDEVTQRLAFRSVLQRELQRITAVLEEVQANVIALKGAAYLAAGEPRGRLREVSDIDLLVQVGNLTRITKALQALGYIEVQGGTDHHLVLQRNVGQIRLVVELHTGLLSAATAGHSAGVLSWISRTFWARSRPAYQGTECLRTLDAPHALMHSALHLALHHFPPRLKWLVDLADQAARLQQHDWAEIMNELEGTAAELPFAFALHLLKVLGPSTLPDSVALWAVQHPRALVCASLATGLYRRQIYLLSQRAEQATLGLHLQLLGAAQPLAPLSPTRVPKQAASLLASTPDEALPEVARWLTWTDINGPCWTRMAMLVEKGPELLSETGPTAGLFRLLAASGPMPQTEGQIWQAIATSTGSRQALMTKLYCLFGLGGPPRVIGRLMLTDLFPPTKHPLSRLLWPAYALRNLMAVPHRFWFALAKLSWHRIVSGRGKQY